MQASEEKILGHVQNPLFSNFVKEVERIRSSDNLDYLEAVLSFCQTKEIDFEVAARYINTNDSLKAKIQEEAENLNYLEKTARLPI